MPNAKNDVLSPFKRILVVGGNGAGKTSQIWTLPGKKFAYVFDPNALSTLHGLDIDYEAFLPDVADLDGTLKGFNKDSKDDKLPDGKRREPKVYNAWLNDFNDRIAANFFDDYQWLMVDSLTFLTQACMARVLYLNGRYGGLEDRADYRVVGAKLSEVFTNIAAGDINIYMTGHVQVYEHEKTHRLATELRAPGSARDLIPLVFTDIWLAEAAGIDSKTNKPIYTVRTVPDPRGLQAVRCSLRGLKPVEDVTIPSFDASAVNYGIGRLLKAKA